MFKFIRYFFFLFVITTVLPLISLFLWTNYQMGKMESFGAQNMIEMGAKQANIAVNRYLKTNQGKILEKIYNLPSSQINETDLKQAFKAEKVSFIYDKNISKISAEYKTIRGYDKQQTQIYLHYVIPIKNSKIKGIEILQKADFKDMDIQGPFVAEIYSSNKVTKENFISRVQDPFLPNNKKPAHKMPKTLMKQAFRPHPPEMQVGIPKNKHIKYALINISDSHNNTIAVILLKTGLHPGKMFAPPFLKDLFALMFLLAGILLTVTSALFINKNFVKPLITLAEASKEVQKGNLSAFIKTETKQKQIIDTFNNFNEMLKGLKQKEDLRDSYIASLTHDLRTPIIAQERALSLISKKFEQIGLNDEYELAKSMEKNSFHLLRLVNLILESYQFSKQKIKLEYSDINLKELVDDCFEKVKPISEDKNISLINNVKIDFEPLNADKVSIERVLINLIFNAVENINENKRVQINAEKEKNIIKIIIEDNGCGIDPCEINHIFDMYYTGKSPNRKLGSGLGLDVCKKLIEMHGGEITVESEVDKYTKFTVTLLA